MKLICSFCRPPGTVPELPKKDGVVQGAGRCIPMGIMELLPLDLGVGMFHWTLRSNLSCSDQTREPRMGSSPHP